MRWLESTGEVLGRPVLPDGPRRRTRPPRRDAVHLRRQLVFDAAPQRQRELQDRTVEVLAKLHSIPDRSRSSASCRTSIPPGDTALHRHFGWLKSWYEFSVPDIGRSPLVERALAWLEHALPRGCRRRPNRFWCGVMRVSATSSTRTFPRSPSWTGRWPPSARAIRSRRGSSSRTWCSRS